MGVDRFGRAAVDNLLAVRDLDAAGVTVVSAREPWLDTSGPFREPMMFLVSWLGEQERKRLIERTHAGIARAREKGTKSGKAIGRPKRLARADVERILELHWDGRSGREIAQALKVPRTTVRRALEALAGQNGVFQNTLRRREIDLRAPLAVGGPKGSPFGQVHR